MKINITKFFEEKEVLSIRKFYEFIHKTKVIVFVPHKFVEIVAAEMSKAGAGCIGNYELCSFRTEGTGTFKPNKKAKPMIGKKNHLSKVEEVKLEMECDPENVNQVIDALLENHPYEETAYEIYDFKKRSKKESGVMVSLKSRMKLTELFSRLNKNLSNEDFNLKNTFKKIVITDSVINNTVIESAKFTNCDYLISIANKNYKLFKLQ